MKNFLITILIPISFLLACSQNKKLETYPRNNLSLEETINKVADNLENGDVEAVLAYFNPSELNREVLKSLTKEQMYELVESFRQSRLIKHSDRYAVFEMPNHKRFGMCSTPRGWIICFW